MRDSNRFFDAINLSEPKFINLFSKKTGIPVSELKYFNEKNILPSGKKLDSILEASNITEMYLRIRMGILDRKSIQKLESIAVDIDHFFSKKELKKKETLLDLNPGFTTKLGKLYQSDCCDFLKSTPDESVDMVFADPPFNLSKLYPSEINDNLKNEKYLDWCEEWLMECVRVLKPGGALFLWNLPKWNSIISTFLNGLLSFRHWIATDIKYSLPIQGRLYPSHYALLYFVKGEKPKTFHPDRLPMQTCPKCFCDLKDYGGYKDKMNPLGVNLSDIWYDIPPVRHAKYKRREGSNELSIKLMDRIIEMSTNEGDIILDPFGGSGTTYMTAELKNRHWIGCEIGPLDIIIDRFKLINEEYEILQNYRKNLNKLFPEKIRLQRENLGLWTCENIKKNK